MAKLIIKLISAYQKTFSPDHGSFKAGQFTGCRFYPSCSSYSKETIEKSGLIKSLPRILWRVLRCNPLARGGVDKP